MTVATLKELLEDIPDNYHVCVMSESGFANLYASDSIHVNPVMHEVTIKPQ